jgi:hypothetical protein
VTSIADASRKTVLVGPPEQVFKESIDRIERAQTLDGLANYIRRNLVGVKPITVRF